VTSHGDESDDRFPGRARESVGRVLEMLAAMSLAGAGLAWVVHPRGHVLVRGARELMIARDLVSSTTLDLHERPRRHDVLGRALLMHVRPLRYGWTLGVLADAQLDGVTTSERIDRAATLLSRALIAPPEGGGSAGDGNSGADARVGLG